MKKLYVFSIMFCLLFSSIVMAQTNEVVSLNVVGFNRVSVPTNSYAQVAIQFDAIDLGDANLMGVFGTNTLRAGGSPQFTDQLLVWNPTLQVYENYALKDSDLQYYNTFFWGGPATNPALVSGQAFWLKTPAAGAYATVPLSFAIVGEVVSTMTKTQDVVSGYQMIGYPFSSDVAINDMGMTNGYADALPINSDQITYWDMNVTNYIQYYFSTNLQWYKYGDVSPTTDAIPLGQGFWYEARNGTNFQWSATNKYIDNL